MKKLILVMLVALVGMSVQAQEKEKKNKEILENQLKENGNGLYIVGLDNHTGYLLLSEEGNYFIHSSGIFPYRVVKDKLAESPILMKSKYRVTGKISADERFLNKWITN